MKRISFRVSFFTLSLHCFDYPDRTHSLNDSRLKHPEMIHTTASKHTVEVLASLSYARQSKHSDDCSQITCTAWQTEIPAAKMTKVILEADV